MHGAKSQSSLVSVTICDVLPDLKVVQYFNRFKPTKFECICRQYVGGGDASQGMASFFLPCAVIFFSAYVCRIFFCSFERPFNTDHMETAIKLRCLYLQ